VSETSLNTPRKILAFAAVVEVGTGLVLIIDPAIVVTLLLGAEVSGVGTLLGRCFGVALLALGLACWPSRQHTESGSPAFRAMLLYIDILDTVLDADSFIGLMGGFEARRGPWGGFLYGMWTKLSADAIPAGPITLQVETELALAEFGGLYRLGEWSLGRGLSPAMAEGEPRLALELYAGGRLAYVQAEIGVNRPPPRIAPSRRTFQPGVARRSPAGRCGWIPSSAVVSPWTCTSTSNSCWGGTSVALASAHISPPRLPACSGIAFRCSDAGRSPRLGIERSGRTIPPGPMGRSSAGM
jgi:hypothetical protein